MLGKAGQQLLETAGNFFLELGQIALVAAVYLGIAYLVVRIFVQRLHNSQVLSRYGRNGSMIAFRIITIAVYLIAFIGVLSYAGVNTNGILTLASAFTVAIGLALQDVIRNLISGIFMVAEKPFSVGDRVTVRDRTGVVQGIDIRTTMLRTEEGALLLVPNQLMFTEILQNDSRFNVRVIRYNIQEQISAEDLTTILNQVGEQVESVRTPVKPPSLLSHTEEATEWQAEFSVSSRKMLHDHEIGEALVARLPKASIQMVIS